MVSSVDFVFEKISQKKDNRYGLVICKFRSGRNVARLPLGFHVTEDDWKSFSIYYNNVESDEPLAKAVVSTLGISNERLAYIFDDIKDRLLNDKSLVCTDEIVSHIVNTRVALHLIDRFNRLESLRRKSLRAIPLVKCMEQYADDKASGKRLKDGSLTKVTSHYIQSLRGFADHIRSFERTHGERITLEDVSMELRDEYIDWCRKKGDSTNTIVHRVEAIHCVMKIAYEEKMTENAIHAHSGFVPKPEKVGSILLSPDQLEQLYELDLSSEEKILSLVEKSKIGKRKMERYKPLLEKERVSQIEQSRDIFLVGCLTGQRYSDYQRLHHNMITTMHDMSFIGVVQKKTQKRVVIPLDVRAVEILRKYEDGLPELKVNQVNECLHLIGELLGWTWRPDFNGNPPHSQVGIRFCDLLTSHTARRSFATNAYAHRVPVESIMAVTGHSSELRLRGYVRDAPEASAGIVAKDFEEFLDLE